jgi:hypothetical protein
MGAELFTTRLPAVGYAERGVPPPAPLYIGPNEHLVVDTWSSTAPAALAIVARVLTPGGEVHTSRWSHTPNTDRSRATTYHALPEGFLLAVIVDATGAAYRRGHCWCQVGIQVGGAATGVPHAQLISDYVTGAARLAWPGGQLRSSVEGPGLLRSITGTDPPAGSEICETVPTGARWRLLSMYFTFLTGGTVANRFVTLAFDDGTNVFGRTSANYIHTAGIEVIYAALTNTQRGDIGALIGIPLAIPGQELSAGWHLRTVTGNFQVSDDFSVPQLLVEEWIEP